MNISILKIFHWGLFQILTLVLFSCENKLTDKNNGAVDPQTINIPTEARVLTTAKDFVRIYLKDKDPKAFLAQADDMMTGDFAPTFNIHQNRWYVFFTDGIYSINVTMSKDLTLGTASALNAKIIASEADATQLKGDYSDLPLFTLSEFEKIVDMPHNK